MPHPMRTPALAALLVLLTVPTVFAAPEGMKRMPEIRAERTYTIQSKAQGQALVARRGFGSRAPEVAAMNRMMVEGPMPHEQAMDGMAGMGNMAGMGKMTGTGSSHSHPRAPRADRLAFEISPMPAPLRVGRDRLTVTIKDRQTGRPVSRLALTALVYDTDMPMGSTQAQVKEVGPGTYQLTAQFSMAGGWAVKLVLPGGSARILPVHVVS